MPVRRVSLCSFLVAVVGFCAGASHALAGDAARSAAAPVDFNRDVRPILSDVCFKCHGPDAAQRKGDLRFDTEDGAKANLGDGRKAIVPGDAAASELVRRITSTDADLKMPPPDAERQLTAAQIETLKRWIAEGAKWQKHWSFLKPRKVPLPAVKNAEWVRTPVDRFVLARLEAEGLAPSPEADKPTLLRRVTLDLTGLPPTPHEVEAFLADDSTDAYERVVDRLLASARYGERMATRWMDGARYADTSGYQSDGERIMWRWRDWVIDAYNADMSFDRFTIEQLAGDLLPNPTLDQRIATGFNRNHRGNAEGGIIPEEYAVEYVVDRVETTATVWLGLTAMCSRCHNHKYDPLAQSDFYRLFAFFNNVPEKGRAVKYGNSPPYLLTPTRDQQIELDHRDAVLVAATKTWTDLEKTLAVPRAAWEKTGAKEAPEGWSFSRGLSLHFPMDGSAAAAVSAPSANARPAGYLGQLRLLEQKSESEQKKYAETGDPRFAPGRVGQALDCDGTRYAGVGDVANFGFFDRFTVSCWINPRGDKGGTIVSRMTDVNHGNGWSVLLDGGKLQMHLSQRYLDDACRSEAAIPLVPDRWQHVVVSYDGSRDAAGIRFHIDGKPVKTVILLDELNQTFATKEPLRIGAGNGPGGRFHGLIDDVRVFDRVLSDAEAALVATPEPVSQIAAIPVEKRTAGQIAKLERCFLETAAPAGARDVWLWTLSLQDELDHYVGALPTTMVMEEMPTPRDTHILIRGEYDKRGEKVTAGVPGSLPALPNGAPANRLGLAQWLVDAENPLTARVAVNRLWQQLFGAGVVKTVDDFGTQGDVPSHPELLDFLAVEFRGAGGQGGRGAGGQEASPPRPFPPSPTPQRSWSVKSLLKTLVTSATYRQSSRTSPALMQRDPENRLLARGPRFRLSAEMVRDQALAASGLLVERLGGPSVKPYQPEGLWKDLAGLDYESDHGDALYRRSLYTYWKRTVAPPAMITFDAAGRETCIVKETRTNTPLQALNLMNDVTYVEASRFLAERMLRAGNDPAARIRFAFLAALGRPPREKELKLLTAAHDRHLAHYQANPSAAESLTKAGEKPRDPALAPAALAANTALAGLILNLDEAVTRE